MPNRPSCGGSSAIPTVAERMEYLFAEFQRLSGLLRSLPPGEELTEASHAIRPVSDRMGDVVGVTPAQRISEAWEERRFYDGLITEHALPHHHSFACGRLDRCLER